MSPVSDTIRTRLRELLTKFNGEELEHLVASVEPEIAKDGLSGAVLFKDASKTVAFNLVKEAETQGVMPNLAAAAARALPLNPEAREIANLFGVAASVPVVANPADVRFYSGQFIGAFLERQQRLGRLRMYKGLHDILHQLQVGGIPADLTRLVKAARTPGYNPRFAGKTRGTLRDWLKVKSLDQPPRWVRKFVEAAQLVVSCLDGETVDAVKVDEQLEYLDGLPAKEQVHLNDLLVEAARGVDVSGLDLLLPNLQVALGKVYGQEFQQRYQDFRETCDTLGYLIGDHDKCQEIDTLLANAVVLIRTAGAKPPEWYKISTLLTQLHTNRPDGAAIRDELIQMVDALKMAGQADLLAWLPSLVEVFIDFFYKLDDYLLTMTDRVLNTAEVLAFRLKGYS